MLYSVAASIYSWVVMFSILFFLFKVFEPYRLQVIGQIIAVASIASLVGRPLWSLGKFFYVPGRLEEVKKPRMYVSLGIVAVVLAAILFLPLPYHVYCMLEVRPRDAQQVYVVVPGELDAVHVKAGQKVERGTKLADLKNVDLELEVAQLKTQQEQDRVQILSLQQARYEDPKAAGQITEIKASMAAIQQQLQEKQADLDRLHLVANRDGFVIPPDKVPPHPSADGKLPSWNGTPLEPRNLGAALQPSTWFCQIGDLDKFEAVLVIDQSDIELVREGQNVKIMLDELPGRIFQSPITDISNNPMDAMPSQLSNKHGGSVETKSDASGMERAINISYRAKAPLDDPDGLMLTGLKGQAKIDADYHSLGWRLWRFLQHTFHFKL